MLYRLGVITLKDANDTLKLITQLWSTFSLRAIFIMQDKRVGWKFCNLWIWEWRTSQAKPIHLTHYQEDRTSCALQFQLFLPTLQHNLRTLMHKTHLSLNNPLRTIQNLNLNDHFGFNTPDFVFLTIKTSKSCSRGNVMTHPLLDILELTRLSIFSNVLILGKEWHVTFLLMFVHVIFANVSNLPRNLMLKSFIHYQYH